MNGRGPLTVSGIYQVIVRRGSQCGVQVRPHRFRHHFSHTRLDRGGPEGDLTELNGWTSPPTTASWTTASTQAAVAATAKSRRRPAAPWPSAATMSSAAAARTGQTRDR
ncbi:MAG TPA: hypothetical protein VN969_40010 [Streptosporangiaceae bacterium]|nr:hypothetical protein [Streptosporangiaceae bacterium]